MNKLRKVARTQKYTIEAYSSCGTCSCPECNACSCWNNVLWIQDNTSSQYSTIPSSGLYSAPGTTA